MGCGRQRDRPSRGFLTKQLAVSLLFDLRRGNAPAEFVLVSALLAALALAVIHVALVIHVRHILQASAWEGARYASYYGTTHAQGHALTVDLISEGLSEVYAQAVSVTSTTVGGEPGVQVRVSAPIPALGLWSFGGDVSVTATVPYEQPG